MSDKYVYCIIYNMCLYEQEEDNDCFGTVCGTKARSRERLPRQAARRALRKPREGPSEKPRPMHGKPREGPPETRSWQCSEIAPLEPSGSKLSGMAFTAGGHA